MTSPQEPSDRPDSNSSPSTTDVEFETALAEVERSLQALKDRYSQIQRDTQHQVELQQRQKHLKKQRHRRRDPQRQAELQQIAEQLEELEARLESTLVSWKTFQEPFWQAVRFGGLGIVIGWVLKSCSG